MSNPGVQLVPSLTHAPRHDHGGHVVQLYTDDGFPIDVLSRFIGGALAVGDAAVGMGIGVDAINAVRDYEPTAKVGLAAGCQGIAAAAG